MGLISLPVLVVVLLGFVAFKVFQYLTAKSTSLNPFREDTCTQVKPKVIDQKQRDAVLKQGFSQDKVPSNLDAVVIGSGIGGLALAAVLAKAKKKVLVLEQHDQAGGCCHTFIDKGYEFDVGIHYIGDVTHRSVTKTLLDQITNGQLEWHPMDDVFDEVVFAEKGKEPRKYPVIKGAARWESSLKEKFPHEADNITRFFKTVEEVSEEYRKAAVVKFLPLWLVSILQSTGLINYFTNFYKWNAKTCKEVVWDMVKTQELRDILCYSFGDFGTPPSKAGFPMQSLLHSHFAKDGGAYPVGGASEIAFNIIPVIEAAGGKVLVRAEVTEILVSEGRAVGVQVKKGKDVVNVTAPLVISDAGAFNTMQRLLPESVASTSRLWPFLKSQPHGLGCMSVFVGINCPADKLNIIHRRNAWLFPGNDIDKLLSDYRKLSREEAMEADFPLLFISFPSTKDPEWEKRFPGKTTMALVTFMPYEWVAEWEKCRVMKRGDEYEVIKNTFGHKAVDQACSVFPDIKEHIDYINIGSPVSNNHYLGAPKGEIYGLDHTSDRFSLWNNAILRPKTDIPGLYLTGQDVCSCGFVGALYGGLFCASSVLQRNIMSDLNALHKQTTQDQKKTE